MGQDKDYPALGVGLPVDIFGPHVAVNARDPSSKQVLLDGAIEGHVLVKNTKNALPLKSPKLLSLFGYDAKAPDQNNPELGANLGLTAWALGFESANVLEAIPGFLGTPLTVPRSQIAINGTIISGGGSGANSPAYINAPFDALQERVYHDNSTILWDFVNVNATAVVDGASDACLVFINAFASEGFDRIGIHDDYSDALVNNVGAYLLIQIMLVDVNLDSRSMQQYYCHYPQCRRPTSRPIHRPS
jgi:beta-glucosidase